MKYTLIKRKPFAIIFALFALIFALISLINHYQFRSHALDLGMFTHAIYSFSHFKPAIFTLAIDGSETSFLSTHFSLITILYSPLSFLFGTYTLLIIQIGAVLLGGYGIYKYSHSLFAPESKIPVWLVIQFFSIWAIYSALAVDFHNNVIGAMLVPWFVLFLEKRELTKAGILMVLILMCKEVMAIWMVFIVLGLIVKNWKTSRKDFVKFEIPAIIFCVMYSILIIGYVMPALQGSESNLQFLKYKYSDDGIIGSMLYFIKNPSEILDVLFFNIHEDTAYDWIKTEMHLVVMISGGVLFFWRPAFFIMLIPIYAQKLLSNDYGMWGINNQYSIEFAPILSLLLIDFVKSRKKNHKKMAVTFALLTIFVTIFTFEDRHSKWYYKENYRFYNGSHYDAALNVSELNKALELIEDESVVSASTNLVPHLAFRDKIYHFPIVKDAEYIALVTGKRTKYPFNEEDFRKEVEKYKNSERFNIIFENEDAIIFKRKGN